MPQLTEKDGMSIFGVIALIIGAGVVMGLLGGGCYGYKRYEVWSAGKTGQAELKRATENRKIAIEEAKAEAERAKYLAQANLEQAKVRALAEVERAKGVAEANRIIGESLEGNESYLRYLWIQGLQDGSSEVIYIPTEANLPILEARSR